MAFLYRQTWNYMTLREQQAIAWPGHIHDEIELIYVREGRGTGVCDGKSYSLQNGDFFLVFPNQSHFYPEDTQGSYILLIVKPSVLRYHQDIFLAGYPVSAVHHNNDPELEQLLLTTMREHNKTPESPVVYGYLTAFFEKLLQNYPIEKSRMPQNLVLNILEYCAQHYREDICLSDICREFEVSRSHISHTFSSRINMSFPDYINALRLTDAEKLLKNQDHSITRIANLCGFPTIRTFNRVFLRRYGVTPTQYRCAAKRK